MTRQADAYTKRACFICYGIWGAKSKVFHHNEGRYLVECQDCGNYIINKETIDDFFSNEDRPDQQQQEIAQLSYLARHRMFPDEGDKIYQFLSTDFLEQYKKSDFKLPDPARQALNLLRFLAEEHDHGRQLISVLQPGSFSIMGSQDPLKAGQILKELHDDGLITGDLYQEVREPFLDDMIIRYKRGNGQGVEDLKRNRWQPIGAVTNIKNAALTVKGWERYRELKKGQLETGYGFIALQFGEAALDEFIDDYICPAVLSELGIEVRRVSQRAGVIDNIIREEISTSSFVLADLTHDNRGAYWEAGYAEGLGKPVIYLCEKEKFHSTNPTHFDTNHCTTVIWDAQNPSDCIEELVATIHQSLRHQ